MIRLIVRRDNAGMAANVGGAVYSAFYTFDIEHPEIEALLTGTGSYEQAQLVGCEVVAALQQQGERS